MFNTLKYARILEEAGFSREQAETSIKILVEIMEDKLATRQDIMDLRGTVADIKSAMATKTDLLQLKHDLTIKMGAMLSGAVALATALHKFI